MVTDFVLEPALFEHISVYVVVELGLTDWLPLLDFAPDQPLVAAQFTGAVAFELVFQDNIALWPLVILVDDAPKFTLGATGVGAGVGVGLGLGLGDVVGVEGGVDDPGVELGGPVAGVVLGATDGVDELGDGDDGVVLPVAPFLVDGVVGCGVPPVGEVGVPGLGATVLLGAAPVGALRPCCNSLRFLSTTDCREFFLAANVAALLL